MNTTDDKPHGIHSIVQKTAQVIGTIGVFLLLLNAGFKMFDVLCRWLFSTPQLWVTEFYEITLPVAIAACFPLTLAVRGMITISALGKMFGATFDRILNVWGNLCLFAFLSVITWQIFDYAASLVSSGRQTYYFSINLGPTWYLVTFFFFFAALVQFFMFLSSMTEPADLNEDAHDNPDML